MRKRTFLRIFFIIFFVPFCMKLDGLCTVSGKGHETQSQKKKRIKAIVESVIKDGGSSQDAVKSVYSVYWREKPELSAEQRKKIETATEELKKILPPSMELTATFTTEEQVLDITRKVQKLKDELPKTDINLLKRKLYADAKKRYPFIPIKPYSKVHVFYMRNGVMTECVGRFHPSSDRGYIHVGPYRIPISDIQPSQRFLFSSAEMERTRQNYVRAALKFQRKADNERFRKLLDRHEDELHLHEHDILYVDRWYTLDEYTVFIYERSMRKKEEEDSGL